MVSVPFSCCRRASKCLTPVEVCAVGILDQVSTSVLGGLFHARSVLFFFRLACRKMAYGEPTSEEMAKLVSISAVVEWAGVPETFAEAFYGAVGANGEEHPLLWAWCLAMDLKINDKPLTSVQKALIRTVHRVCCLMSGTAAPAEETKTLKDQLDEVVKTVETLSQAGSPEDPSGKPSLGNPQAHLKLVISQASGEGVTLISQSDLLKHWDCLKKIRGRDPKQDEECTGDQLTGVNALLQRDMVPYVYFGVCGDRTITAF